MSDEITRLERARAMKAIGLPLNTPLLEGGKLPERCEKMIIDTLKAASRCRSAVYAYIENQNMSTYSKLKRTHEKLGREIAKIPAPNWIDEPDGKRLTNPQDAIVTAVVGPRCFTAFRQWEEIIATLESGNAITRTIDAWPVETGEQATTS